MLNIYDFSVDYVIAPTLVRTRGLRFGWKLDSDNKDVLQKDYRIVIADENGITADTGVIESSSYFDITIPDLILSSRTDYTVTVTVHDNHGDTAAYTHTISTEILPEEWDAEWIKPEEHIAGWAPYLRTKFEVTGVRRAVLYACGLGIAQYTVNGKCIHDFVLDPPATNYEKTVLYRRFDITDTIIDGGNALAVQLGEGFYSQSRVWGHQGMVYGDVCLIARLEITLDDGTTKVITTNTRDWKYKYSPITTNNIYAGEVYDCRLETPDFADYHGSERGWGPVISDETPKGKLTPCLMPPIRVVRTLPAVSVHCAAGKDDGAWIFDIGENMAGVAEFRMPHSPRGAVYVFRYAENLTANGQLDMRSTGAFATQCIQQDMYICRGDEGGEIYRPTMTYHGYRYVEVTGFHDFSDGYGTMPKCSLVTGIQVATDLTRTAKFRTSHTDLEHLNDLMHNTFLSNYHGYPEDCPAREKCGWLGDAEVVCNWGLLYYDSIAAYEKYMDDIRTTRDVYGVWQMIAPGKRGCGEATPLWGCAQIIIPYYMYHYGGDREAVTDNFDLMEAWVAHELSRSTDYIISEGLGDWCPPGGHETPTRMPVAHSSTLMFYEICIRMAELCDTFGMGDAAYYKQLADSIRESFIRHYYNAEAHSFGYWGTDGCALTLGLYPDGEHDALLSALRKAMADSAYAMPTGIYANKYLVPALFENGCGDEALRFLFNREKPSFATMMDDHATTIWEAPDMKHIADTDAGVASYNHPMHGGFLYFTLAQLCGLKPAAPGFAKVVFSPCFADGTDHIGAEIMPVSGKFSVSIDRTDDGHLCTLTVPAGVTFTVEGYDCVTLDGSAYHGETIGSGTHTVLIRA
ncbi:MAG: family 78 glycoside hydrolase catalytic domain [Clostridia bacterium]|nr:family 78 glycoside hydrolase catalytic domain [Clostridia bacterium]